MYSSEQRSGGFEAAVFASASVGSDRIGYMDDL
jgi:hypothetical protein